MKERKNVYQLPAGDSTLNWYAKAVAEMKKRPTTDPTSWNFEAAVHGFKAGLSYWKNAGTLPDKKTQDEFWNQCQHGSWFFLPWHRMYLAYFEQMVAKTVADLGGPADWALPFWDYSDTTNPDAIFIPPAFTTPGDATNALWMTGRKNNKVRTNDVTLGALNVIPYTGNGKTSPLGFGGPETSFSHSGGTHGELESKPHDLVHVDIGGAMGDPRTAALDPIFWLHHANIDRLWQVWINQQGGRLNPVKVAWLDTEFEFHDDKGATIKMKGSQVIDTTKVLSGYTCQGVPSGTVLAPYTATAPVDYSLPLDVAAATNKKVVLGSSPVDVPLKITPSKRNLASFSATTGLVAGKPATAILHFENITGKGVPPVYDVYLDVPKGAKDKDSYFAGSLAFFGVEESSVPSLHHSGSGQHYALDVTSLISRLRGLPNWKEQELDVRLEPREDADKDASVSIGRISLYSE